MGESMPRNVNSSHMKQAFAARQKTSQKRARLRRMKELYASHLGSSADGTASGGIDSDGNKSASEDELLQVRAGCERVRLGGDGVRGLAVHCIARDCCFCAVLEERLFRSQLCAVECYAVLRSLPQRVGGSGLNGQRHADAEHGRGHNDAAAAFVSGCVAWGLLYL